MTQELEAEFVISGSRGTLSIGVWVYDSEGNLAENQYIISSWSCSTL